MFFILRLQIGREGFPYIGRGAPSGLHIYLEPKGLRAVWTNQRNYAADHYKQM